MASRPPETKQPANKGAIAACIAAACACATPLIMQSEGLRTKPYLDPVKIPTVCYGETNVPMRAYSKDECGAMLRERLARIYAPKVLACIPQLAAPERRHEFAALIDSSYNAGPAAVCKSPMAAHFRAGEWSAGCERLPGWYVTARDRRTGQRVKLRGLVIRREEARDLCLRPEPQLQQGGALPGPRFPRKFAEFKSESPINPPPQFMGNADAIVKFTDALGVAKACDRPAPTKTKITLACFGALPVGGGLAAAGIVLPNPCLFRDEFYAAIACHELGHRNGWRHD